jgi:FtsZ-binding cell division protein ZapB
VHLLLLLLLLLLQVREELASWQDKLAASTAKSAAAEAALLSAQPEIEELQHRMNELQQGNGRLKEQLATQVGGARLWAGHNTQCACDKAWHCWCLAETNAIWRPFVS